MMLAGYLKTRPLLRCAPRSSPERTDDLDAGRRFTCSRTGRPGANRMRVEVDRRAVERTGGDQITGTTRGRSA